VTDVSPDGRSVLFLDGSPTAGTLGTWVRSLDGGEAARIADADPGKFSPDGRWVVAMSRLPSGPQQLVLVPVTGGKIRAVTSSPTASYGEPSFAGAEQLLCVRSESGRREVWRMKIDGTGAERLEVTGCAGPVADPEAARILCLREPDFGALVLYAFAGGDTGRPLYELPSGETFCYARWSTRGDRVFAVTTGGRFLDLNATTGAVLGESRVPVRGGILGESLFAAACSPDGAMQAFSISNTSSRLYLGRGLS
jgi:hypothetical protein